MTSTDALPLNIEDDSETAASTSTRDFKSRLSVLSNAGNRVMNAGHSRKGYDAVGEFGDDGSVEYHFPENPSLYDYCAHPVRYVFLTNALLTTWLYG